MSCKRLRRGRLVLVACERGTVVEEDADVDAHDGNDAAHVEVHHEHALEDVL